MKALAIINQAGDKAVPVWRIKVVAASGLMPLKIVNATLLTKRSRGTITSTADAGTVNLSFATSQAPVSGTKGRTIDHIGFEIKGLAAFVKQLEAKGVTFDVPFREVPSIGLKIAYVTDPSGVYIELTEGYVSY